MFIQCLYSKFKSTLLSLQTYPLLGVGEQFGDRAWQANKSPVSHLPQAPILNLFKIAAAAGGARSGHVLGATVKSPAGTLGPWRRVYTHSAPWNHSPPNAAAQTQVDQKHPQGQPSPALLQPAAAGAPLLPLCAACGALHAVPPLPPPPPPEPPAAAPAMFSKS